VVRAKVGVRKVELEEVEEERALKVAVRKELRGPG